MTAQFIRWLARLMIASALWSGIAFSAGSTMPGSYAKCGAMSHIDAACRQSRPAPSFTPRPATWVTASPKLDACTRNFRERPVVDLIAACEAFLDADAGTPRELATAMFHLGHAYTYAGRTDESAAVWKLAAETDPRYVEPLLAMGNKTALGADPMSAMVYFDAVLRIDPREARAKTGRARALFQANQLADALRESKAAAALAPDDPTARQVYGAMLEYSGSFAEAAAEYKLATQGYDVRLMQDRNPWLELARALERAGKPQDAVATVDAYLATVPASMVDGEIYLARAKYREAAGQYAGAAEDLGKAAGIGDASQAMGLGIRRALLLHKAGLPDKALRELELLLARGDLNLVLRLQVFLKNSGELPLDITGHYDGDTQKALRDCLSDPTCGRALGQRT